MRIMGNKEKIPQNVFDVLLKKFRLYQSGVPEDYDYYGPKSTYKEDYDQMVGNMLKDEAEK